MTALLAVAGLASAGAAGAQTPAVNLPDSTRLVLNEDDAATSSRGFRVKLSAAPSSTLTVGVASSGRAVEVSPASLTFTTTDWDSAQTVTVTAESDLDNLDPDPVTLTLTGGAAPKYVYAFVHDDEATLVTSAGGGAMGSDADWPDTHENDSDRIFQQFRTGRSLRHYHLESVTLYSLASSTGGAVVLFEEDRAQPGRPALDTGVQIGAWAASDIGTGSDTGSYVHRSGEVSVITVRSETRRITLSRDRNYFLGLSAVRDSSDDDGIAWACADRAQVGGHPGWSASTNSLEYDGTSFTNTSGCRLKFRIRGTFNGVDIRPQVSSVTVNEGGNVNFDVDLKVRPESTVTVQVRSSDPDSISAAPATLTFTRSNSGRDQTVTVTGVQDSDTEDETVPLALFGDGVLSAVVPVTARDDDGKGYAFSPPALDVEEGSTGTYTVKLRAAPSAAVTVAVASTDADVATVSASSLTFTTSTWDAAQTVTVTGVEDDDAVDETLAVSHTATSSDADYQGLAVNVNVAVDDDEWMTIGFTKPTWEVRERTGAFSVSVGFKDPQGALTAPGTRVGTLLMYPRQKSGGEARHRALAGSDFSPDGGAAALGPNLSVARLLARLLDDALLEHDESFEVFLQWNGGEPYWAGEEPQFEVRLDPTPAEVVILSDDTGTLDFDADAYEVTEGEDVDIVPSLSARIEHELPITVSLGAALREEAEFLVMDGSSQTRNSPSELAVGLPASANGSQSPIRVRALKDSEVESDEAGVVSVTIQAADLPRGLSLGANLGANSRVDLTVLQAPNATASGRPAITGAATVNRKLTASKGTASDADDLPDDADLDWQWIRQDDAAGTGAADIPSATAANYTLSAADEGKWVIVKMSWTDGAGYEEELRSVAVGPVATPGLDLSLAALTVDEGRNGTFEAALAAEPSATVTVTATSGDATAVTVSPSSLTFTTSNWDEARTLTVTAVEDDVIGDREATVTLAASGGDYASVSGTVTVTAEDNEVPGLVLTPSRIRVPETGTAAYTVALTALPSASVTVTVTSGDATAAELAPSSLTFTTSNWDEARTLTVTAVEDDDLDHEEVAVTHTASGGGYGSVSETVTVTLADDDLLSWDADDLPFLVVNEGLPVERRVQLVSSPSAALVVVADVGDEAGLDVSPSALAFDSATWDEAQTFTFTAVEDDDGTDLKRAVTFAGGGVTQSRTVHVHDDEATFVSSAAEGPAGSPPGDGDLPKAWAAAGERGYQAFTTGARTHGYTLESLSLALRASGTPGAGAGPSDVVVKLVPATSAGDAPDLDAEPATLGTIPAARQAPGRVDLHDLRFPGVRLQATTTYFVEISNPGADRDQASFFDCAAGGGEFGLSGWSVADGSVRDDDGTLRDVACVLPMRAGGAERTPPPPSTGPGPETPDPEPEPDPQPPVDTGPLRAAFGVEGAFCADGLCRTLTGSTVRFVDASQGPAASWLWDFDDRTASRQRSPSHSWSTPGFYEVSLRVSGGGREASASRTFLVEASSPAGGCVAGDLTRCLLDSRFSVEIEWWTASGESGSGAVVRRGSNDSALFQFFGANNWEALVKVLDGCAINGHVWVFGAMSTDLGYRITVTDTATGAVREYLNESGARADAITDTTAFPDTCEAPNGR